MKKRTGLFAGLAVMLFCSSLMAASFPVTEANSDIPYEFKGAIEIEDSPNSLVGNTVRLATLGLLGKPRIDSVKKRLNAKLADKAKLYSPDAVVNVVYSPAPDDPRFLTSRKVYAKGDMVQYKKAYNY